MATIPTQEPLVFNAGNTVQWKIALDDYKASDGWVLKYAARSAQAAAMFDIIASADGDAHLVDLAKTTTAAYKAGKYSWQSYVEKGSERWPVASGYFEVHPDFATVSTVDDRLLSLTAQVNAINEFLGKNYKYSTYSIAGRSLSNYSVDELFKLRNNLQTELNALEKAERVRRGMGGGNIVKVRVMH